MKKIGFIDDYLGNWHANNYPKWIEEANEKLGTDYRVSYAYAKTDLSPDTGMTTGEWCEKNGVERCSTIDEVCEKSDVLCVLAPNTPETHLELTCAVFPHKKRTYVDKTFAPDLATAKKIFAEAAKHGTPFFSTSALRYAEELDRHAGAVNMMVSGGGRALEIYVIHQTEMVVKLLDGSPAREVRTERYGAQSVATVRADGGKTANIIYDPSLTYSVCSESAGGEHLYTPVTSAFFPALITDILRFWETGKVPFDTRQTLEVARIRDAVLASHGDWVKVEN